MKLFIFHRDLRIYDNTGFLQMLKNDPGEKWLPAFIFDPQQIDPQSNKYFSEKSVTFMMSSIMSLRRVLPSLRLFYGLGPDVLQSIHSKHPLTCIYYNVDYTPFARKRDAEINDWCEKVGVKCVPVETEYSLVHVQAMEKPYQMFTPFYRHYVKVLVPAPRACVKLQGIAAFKGKNTKFPHEVEWSSPKLKHLILDVDQKADMRAQALKIVDSIARGVYKDYDKTREVPSLERGTTHLSPYLKYGCVSVREVYHAVLKAHTVSHGLIRELYWRAFYEQVAWWFPKVLEGMVGKVKDNKAMRDAYDTIAWKEDDKGLTAWKEGRTGFPIVDAGMRELNETGWMHNRLRMIVASFLTKDLLIDWREGERYFSTKLVDIYHPSNNGGWQWSSGSGADAQQYYRIFNPWLQAKRYDPEGTYIKKWVSELGEVPVKDIHQWDKCHVHWKSKVEYPAPILDHSKAAKEALERYKKYLQKHK